MTIYYKKGNVVDAQTDVIAHGCNCRGAFNRGVAKAIREKFPDVYAAYKRHNPKILGTCQFVKHEDKILINAFTQKNYGSDGKKYADLEAIGSCLDEIAEFMKKHDYKTIAMPKIGCGLGGLDWSQVSILVENLLEDYDVFVYELE